MSKVYESDVDPDEFIRSFREESSQSTERKENEREKKKEPSSKQPESRRKDRQPQLSDDEEDYLNSFVRNMEHVRPLCKYTMVDIHPDFIKKIKRILSYESGQVCSTKAYINNVLAEHFRQYETFINKRQ